MVLFVRVSLHKHLFRVRSSVSVFKRIQQGEPPGICVHKHGRDYAVGAEEEEEENKRKTILGCDFVFVQPSVK